MLDIDKQLSLIQGSLDWENKFKKETFPKKEIKEYRRLVKKIQYALQNRCSIAAYGESQVGKSYLMSSLLSSSDSPFVIVNNGKEYSFVDEINPSGGNNTKIESTGIITRFTTDVQNNEMQEFVKIQNFSVADIIMLITDSYYNDVKIDARKSMTSNDINEELIKLQSIWQSKHFCQDYLDEDTIRDIEEYMLEVIGNGASNVCNSDFFNVIAENITYIPVEKWSDVFRLLWNKNESFSRIFSLLISEFQKLQFQTEVYVPFSTILREKGTLLQIQWLDIVCGKTPEEVDFPELKTDVYDKNGKLIFRDFPKTYLSAFTAEVTIILPASIMEERRFLNYIDMLDFPGARNRLDRIEGDIDYIEDMPEMLRRGKVAYLFNKYVRTRQISSIMFCHHNDMKSANLGNFIKEWVEKTVGLTPKARAESLKALDNVSPLFMIATKFNIDLSKLGTETPGKLANHWKRFTHVFPEIIGTYQWFNSWEETGSRVIPFQNIYPLRDFYWSGCGANKSHLFDGYSNGKLTSKSGETGVHEQEGFPGYFEELHDSFVNLPFVKEHFADPEQTWNDVATPNNDGSKAIIRAIDKIAPRLNSARTEKYFEELKNIKEKILQILIPYHEPEDPEAKLQKTKMVVNRIRARLLINVVANAQIFGQILDCLMIDAEEIRKIAKAVIVLKVEVPKEIAGINLIRYEEGINSTGSKDENLNKLLSYHEVKTKEELNNEYANTNYTVDDIISGEEDFCATVSDVVTKHILKYWVEYLNTSISSLSKYLPFTEEIILAFQTLAKKFKLKQRISTNIARYDKMFNVDERLNAIADYAALELNGFISTVGRKFMSEKDIQEIKAKAAKCDIVVDLSPEGIEPVREKQPLVAALAALDASVDIMRKPKFDADDMRELRKLPLWDNFMRWRNLLLIGMILSSSISVKGQDENKSIGELIEKETKLYA